MELIELEAAGAAKEHASFERSFRSVLQQLDEENSVLRMGSHVQLAFRLILTGTSEYLDAVGLYKAAIWRLQCLLRERSQPDKHYLIAKVSLAKLELDSLLRMVEPFTEHVMPRLREEIVTSDSDDAIGSRMIRHHMVDIENNLRQLLQQTRSQLQVCESLISEYDRLAGDKVNNILNILTIITFLVMPTHLLTGLCGMNFSHMPELKWGFGYHYFFALSCGATLLFTLLLIWIYRVAT